jgi:hypothetical protein
VGACPLSGLGDANHVQILIPAQWLRLIVQGIGFTDELVYLDHTLTAGPHAVEAPAVEFRCLPSNHPT